MQFSDRPAGGAQILAGATLREMQRAQFVNSAFSGGRGLGFGVSRAEGVTLVSHGGWIGGNRTHFLLAPASKLAVIVAVNADDASPFFFARKIHDILAPAVAKASATPAGAPVPDPAWERYIGVYSDPWGWEYQVRVMGGELVIYEHDYPPEDDPRDGMTRLTPSGEHTFKMADGETVVFELGADGKVERLRWRFEYLEPVKKK